MKHKSIPDITVVTCHHTGSFIYGFVDSIKKSNNVNFEITIVTSDDKLSIEGIYGCHVINGPQFPAAKRNKGVRSALGKYIAFFDDDTEIDENCLFEFKDYLDKNPNVGMVFGKLWNGDKRNRFDEAGGYLTSTGFIWSRAGQNDVDNGQYDKAEPIFAGKSASCMIRKELFNNIGGFDEEFGILGEETLLSWRVWLSGQEVHFVPTAVGLHYFNTKRKDTKKHYTHSRVFYNGSRNYVSMLFMCLETKNLWRILPIHLMIWFFAGVAMIGTGKLRQGWNILKGLGYCVKHWRTLLKKRNRIQDKRTKSDRDIWPFIFRNAPNGYYKQRLRRYVSLGLHG